MFKFLHAADLHLDSPLKGLKEIDPSLRTTIQGATRDAVLNLIGLAKREKVDFVLLAGDLFDGDIQDPGTGHFLLNQLGALSQTIPAFLIRGNHDALNQMSNTLTWPKGVRQIGSTQADTVKIDALRVAIHGRGFGSRAEEANLAAGYPDPVPGYFNIGLLHTSLTGAEGHNSYAPTTPEQLTLKRYDYWALGHIHKREIVRAQRPAIVFPGNTQGRSIRETGPRGCAVVQVDRQGACKITFEDLDTVRWEQVRVDLTGVANREEMLARVDEKATKALERSDRKVHVVRIVLAGSGSLFEEAQGDRGLRAEMENLLAGLGRGVCLEKLKWEAVAENAAPQEASAEDLELIQEMVARFQGDPAQLARVLAADGSWKTLNDRLAKTFDRQEANRIAEPSELLSSVASLYEKLRNSR